MVVVTASDLDVIVRENPLAGAATDPSRLFVAFVAQAFGRRFGEAATTRNWSTVLKLHAAASRGKRDHHRPTGLLE